MTSYRPVEAVVRGLAVLDAVSRLGAARAGEIQALTGGNAATTVRMLETLIHAGYVFQDGPRGAYRLTRKVVGLAAGYRPAGELAAVGAPVLARLQGDLGWPSDLAIFDGEAMVTVATSPAAGRLSFNQPAGFRAGVFESSLGRAYIAFALEAERLRAIEALADDPGAQDGHRGPEAMARKLRAVARAGYAAIDRTVPPFPGAVPFRTIGVPVLVEGVAVAALNVIFLRHGLTMRAAIRAFVPAAKRAAAAIAAGL